MRAAVVGPGLVVALMTSGAAADTFCYVDRRGYEHLVKVNAADAPPPPPAPAAVAPDVAPPLLAGARASASASTPDAAPQDDAAFPFEPLVTEAAAFYSLPVALIRAVMLVESGGRVHAVSSSGALGLMQIMPATAVDLEVTDPFDPRQNVFGGARLLRILVNAFDGDLGLALAAYHAGAGRVRRSGGIPEIPETRRYIARVVTLFHQLQAGGTAPAAPSGVE
jgi:soluble lytic murein transglycosylase-like protein